MSGIIKKSIDLSGHLTSISLEKEYWDALAHIAKDRNCSLRKIILKIDGDRINRQEIYNLSSSIRVFILEYFRFKDSLPSR